MQAMYDNALGTCCMYSLVYVHCLIRYIDLQTSLYYVIIRYTLRMQNDRILKGQTMRYTKLDLFITDQ